MYLCCPFRRKALLNRNIRVVLGTTAGSSKMNEQFTLKKTERYEEMLNKAVDRALNRIFGTTAANIIYAHLEGNYSIKKNEIAEKIESFSQAMQDYLNSGAAVIEKEILESFYSGLGLLQRVELEGNRNTEFVERLRILIPQ